MPPGYPGGKPEDLIMKTSQITIREYISKEKERAYYFLPFEVSADVCHLDIEYCYRRFDVPEQEEFL